jgi:hypothetical protein
MPELVPSLPDLIVGRQEAVHRPLGAEILPLVEQSREDLRGGEVHESRLVERVEHRGALLHAEGPERSPPLWSGTRGLAPPVVCGPRQPERRAGRRDAEPGPDFGHRGHQERAVSGGVPSNAATFLDRLRKVSGEVTG